MNKKCKDEWMKKHLPKNSIILYGNKIFFLGNFFMGFEGKWEEG